MNCFVQILCFLSILIVGCSDDYNFPNVNVNESVPITMPQYNNVYGNLWGYEFINGGLGGIIIVQGLDNEFFAYDRACTYEANENCILQSESTNNPILICSECCESKFLITDGSVSQGPANQPLKRYNTYFDGEILYITN